MPFSSAARHDEQQSGHSCPDALAFRLDTSWSGQINRGRYATIVLVVIARVVRVEVEL